MLAEGNWETPLGNIKINSELSNKLVNGINIVKNNSAHENEHSIEMINIFIIEGILCKNF